MPSALAALPSQDIEQLLKTQAEPAALAKFEKQFRAIGVADITVLSGQTVEARKFRGEVSYNLREATMDELRPEIAKAAAAGQLPGQDSTVAAQGGSVIIDEGKSPNTQRPLDLDQKSRLLQDAAEQFRARQPSAQQNNPTLTKNHKAIVEDFLTHNSTPEQVADFQSQLDTKGSAKVTLVNAQTIIATHTNLPAGLPSVRYDIRPATLAEYQPHLAMIHQSLAEKRQKAGTGQEDYDAQRGSSGRAIDSHPDAPNVADEEKSIAVRLTDEQARLLIANEHPSNVRAQNQALYEITNTDKPVAVLSGRVNLDYSDEQQTYFATLDEGSKATLDRTLTQLQAKQSQSQQRTQPRQEQDDDYERD